jgi:hypothetical protein
MKLMRNMLIAAKLEVTEGVDAAPLATDAMLVSGVQPTPINATFADRNNIQPFFGHTGNVQISSYSQISFSVELAGSGALGTAPKFAPLLKSSGFSETITPATKVDYVPLTTNQKSLTIDCYLDGVLHKMVGCKGSVAFSLSAGGIPMMTFTYTGYAAVITDTPNLTGLDFSAFKAPLGVNKVNTPTFTLHGIAVKAKELSIDMANVIEYRNYIGSEAVAWTDRKPTGNATIEYDSMATKNWWAASNLGTLDTINMVHGTVAGNISQLTGPKVRVTTTTINDDGGVAMLPLGLILQPNLGNDELMLTFK